MIPATCPCCEVLHPPHRDGCTFDDDCPNEAAIFDEMSALRAEIAKLREERRWISVGEKLPKPGETVLMLMDDRDPVSGWYENGHFHNAYDTPYVTHWMPLPPGPEGDGNG